MDPSAASSSAGPQSSNSSHLPPPSPAAAASRQGVPPAQHRSILPWAFRSPFASDQTSTTLVPSTAEGKPIPVDDSIVEHRTSALRELNHHYPSRHRYAQSTGAQSTTYSEPVIVRSYYAPASSKGRQSARRGVVIRPGQPTTATENAGPAAGIRRVIPFASSSGNATLGSMAKKLVRPGAAQGEEPKLPPLEAFTFKSFVANMETHAYISADLDRIAEICAKSRYSLSNQYEVHYQPHGSGSAFATGGSGHHDSHGPTLQVVNPDEDRNMARTNSRRRGPGRRNSRAMGTLETIISSSRSSEEERTRKKPALELAEGVRGRASTTSTASATPSSTTASSQRSKSKAHADRAPPPPVSERRSSTLALLEAHTHPPSIHAVPNETHPARTPAAGLVSQPALPQASTSQLEIRTAPEGGRLAPKTEGESLTRRRSETATSIPSVARRPLRPPDGPSHPGSNLLVSLSNWMPWRTTDHGGGSGGPGCAEGSLRDLLKNIDGGKATL